MTSSAEICPRCYKKIPQRTESVPEQHIKHESERRSDKTAFLLALIPGLFGFLGLGKIYLDRNNRDGWMLLAAGLVLFFLGNGLIFGTAGLLVFLAIPIIILYVLLYLYALANTAVNGFFTSLGLKIQ